MLLAVFHFSRSCAFIDLDEFRFLLHYLSFIINLSIYKLRNVLTSLKTSFISIVNILLINMSFSNKTMDTS